MERHGGEEERNRGGHAHGPSDREVGGIVAVAAEAGGEEHAARMAEICGDDPERSGAHVGEGAHAVIGEETAPHRFEALAVEDVATRDQGQVPSDQRDAGARDGIEQLGPVDRTHRRRQLIGAVLGREERSHECSR